MVRKTYDIKFENAFTGAMAANGIEDEELIAFAVRFAAIIMPRAKFRGIPGERAGKLAADICRPLFEMMRVTA